MGKNNRRSKGEGSFYRLKNGNWRLRFPHQGKFRDVTAPTKAEALQKKITYLKAHPHNCGTVAEHFIWWLQNVKAIELKPTSYDRLESTVQKCLDIHPSRLHMTLISIL